METGGARSSRSPLATQQLRGQLGPQETFLFLLNTKPNKIWGNSLKEGKICNRERWSKDVVFGYKTVSEIKQGVLW